MLGSRASRWLLFGQLALGVIMLGLAIAGTGTGRMRELFVVHGAEREAAQKARQDPAWTGPTEASGARLMIPVDGVSAAQLRDTFIEPRAEERRHDAIDIPAPLGTPVRAAAAGRIEKLHFSRNGGNTIYLRLPGGAMLQYYAHLDRYAPQLAEGQQVRPARHGRDQRQCRPRHATLAFRGDRDPARSEVVRSWSAAQSISSACRAADRR
jgi:hypothetical protein